MSAKKRLKQKRDSAHATESTKDGTPTDGTQMAVFTEALDEAIANSAYFLNLPGGGYETDFRDVVPGSCFSLGRPLPCC